MAYTTIDNPELYFQTKAYTGTGSSHAVTLDGSEDMQPDWVWIKARSQARNHKLYDSVRGVTKTIGSNETDAEATVATSLTAFGSDGFTVSSDVSVNESSETFVAWNWKAGGSASSNSNGSITSSVSASTDAGFSIVSWTGNGSTATIGHSLGSAPKVVIIKSRDNAHAWFVGHESLGWTKYMTLENNNAINDDVIWNDTDPTSNVFSVGSYSSTNGSGVKFIGYCFAEKQGYSKFGSYTGNGNADGPFVYTGFLPAWIMIKKTSGTGNWMIIDNKRSASGGFNVLGERIKANTSEAGSTADYQDNISNGFKIRTTASSWNDSGGTYIYMAFAEAPFTNSNGIPNNAR